MINRNFTSTALFEIRGWNASVLDAFVKRHAPDLTGPELLKYAAQLSLDYYIHPNGEAFDNLQDNLEEQFGYNELTEDSPDYVYEQIEREVQVYVEIVSDFARYLDKEIERIASRIDIPLSRVSIDRAFVRGHTFGLQLVDYDREVW
ncbi:hypothetical protein 2050HW_00303 [Serratia phage vB_SmaM_ 2050HW]|uniref:Uncharacterized protein n=1 Tax=Serratia phage vB_SmaM_ 2050HW TaxID=2024252 RepID=A0A289ZU96_9CAUD|nr:hypothetical protein HWB23_gp303 [Serratia phage vB_SmaM_ 2050HW]ATA65638.1 hypothetical protein 2050HW_00303 [Serratia phage vB_SmaM_ 2050HW]UQT03756.1 hypothetical protein KODAMA_02890 [Serratia phage vB_SmaM-Kodama]URG14144.1 hypothetical protein [Pectobacterium phage vB_ParM-25]